MPDHRSWGGLLLGLGLVWLALGFRLGLVGITQGLEWQRLALGGLLLGVALLGVALLTQPESGQPVPRPSRRQRGYARWSIRLWTLGWMLQLAETRVRCALYAAIWAHRWKKP
jgi:hypothetical protein